MMPSSRALPRPIALAALTVLDLDPPSMVLAAHEAGYSHVGLRLIPATPEEVRHDCVGDTPLFRETRARLDDTGVRAFDVEIFRLTPDTNVGDYRAALETGARLGASHALVAGNDPDETRLTERFAAFCGVAADYAMTANLEPMPWTDVKGFIDGLRVVRNAAQRNGAVLIDAIHFDRAGGVAAQILEAPANCLHYMQICDAPAAQPTSLDELLFQAREHRLLPGDGGLDLAGIVGALPRDLPVSVEIPRRERSRSIGAFAHAREALDATLRWLDAHAR
ncbi:MAG TPA: TIM barrel protein [Casimicrobiaceae bacterium]|nr:TIM barrel protein [Casimicrobiaceae bacterium]